MIAVTPPADHSGWEFQVVNPGSDAHQGLRTLDVFDELYTDGWWLSRPVFITSSMALRWQELHTRLEYQA